MANMRVLHPQRMRVTEDSDEGGVDGADVGMCKGPAAGAWVLVVLATPATGGSCEDPWNPRGGCGALMVVVPVAVGEVPVSGVGGFGDGGAGGLLVDDGFAGGVGGDERLEGEVVDGAGVAAGGGVDEGDGVVAEEGVGAAGELDVVGDVAGCLGAGHG